MKKLHLVICATSVALLTFSAVLPAQQAVMRRFGFDDFSKVRRVSDPQFSPDGSTLAYLVSTPNLDENRHVASLYRIPQAAARNSWSMVRSTSACRFHDGRRMASRSRFFPQGRFRGSPALKSSSCPAKAETSSS